MVYESELSIWHSRPSYSDAALLDCMGTDAVESAYLSSAIAPTGYAGIVCVCV